MVGVLAFMKFSSLAPLIWGVLFIAQLPMLIAYLTRLMADPIYGLLPWAIGLAGGLLFTKRWNREFRFPRPWLPLGLAGLGTMAALVSAISGNEWLAIIGFLGTTGGFLVANRDWQGRQLLSLWVLLLPLARLPSGGNASVSRHLAEWLEASTHNVLSLGNVPHVMVLGGVALPGWRLYLDQQVYSWWSWPLFIFGAMLHSACWRRNWLQSIANGVSALLWCFVFHLGIVSTAATLHLSEVGSLEFVIASLIWFGVVYLLFLSTERAVLSILSPIAEGAGDTQMANPLVVAWNWCFDEQRRRRSPKRNDAWSRYGLRLGSIAAIVALLLAQTLRLTRVASFTYSPQLALNVDGESLRGTVFADVPTVDYRRARCLYTSGLEGVVDVWSVFLPLATSQYTLSIESSSSRNVVAGFQARGWRVAQAPQPLEGLMLPAQPLTTTVVGLEKDTQRARLSIAWLDSAGRPLTTERLGETGTYLLTSLSILPINVSPIFEDSLDKQFLAFCGALHEQLSRSVPDLRNEFVQKAER